MKKWTVVCGRGLTAVKRARAAVDAAYLTRSRTGEITGESFKRLCFVFLWATERLRANCVEKFLVHELLDGDQVPPFEGREPFF